MFHAQYVTSTQSAAGTPVPAERTLVGTALISGGSREPADSSLSGPAIHSQRPENALDALLDELQTFSRPSSQLSYAPTQSLKRAPTIAEIGRKSSVDSACSQSLLLPTGPLRRLHSYPSSSDTESGCPTPVPGPKPVPPDEQQLAIQKPPVPERNAELLQLAGVRRVPPPPPPRTSSRSPLASPTSPQLPPRTPSSGPRGKPPGRAHTEPGPRPPVEVGVLSSQSNSSSCESVNSQEGLQSKKERQEQLEQRHQELLRKQKALQEQYARLQQLQRNATGAPSLGNGTLQQPGGPPDLLKKTGSESNILAKMGLALGTGPAAGSLSSLPASQTLPRNSTIASSESAAVEISTTSKVYETDIL